VRQMTTSLLASVEVHLPVSLVMFPVICVNVVAVEGETFASSCLRHYEAIPLSTQNSNCVSSQFESYLSQYKKFFGLLFATKLFFYCFFIVQHAIEVK